MSSLLCRKWPAGRVWLFLGLGGFCLGRAAPEAAAPALESMVDRTQITIGDQVHYTVSLQVPAGTRVEMPGLGVQLGQFEIKDYQEEPVQTPAAGTELHLVRYLISTYATGRFIIPPLPVRYTLPGDTVPRILLADKIEIEVKPVPAADTTKLAEIRPPVRAGQRQAWLAGLAAILAAGGAVFFLYWRRWRAGRDRLKPLPPPRSADETAWSALAELENSPWFQLADSRPFTLRLSEIQRQYLKNRFGLEALESTTAELEALLPEHNFTPAETSRIISFCQALDLVKFAKQQTSPEQRRKQLQQLREYIQETKEPEIPKSEIQNPKQTA